MILLIELLGYYGCKGLLSRGIRPIVDDLDFAQFIDIGFEYVDIYVYVDRNGNGLEEWWDDDMNLVISKGN